MKQLRNLIFLYCLLWVFEGALRRWVLPSLANPLLLVRDPVVLLIYFQAIRRGLFPMNGFLLSMVAVVVPSFFLTLMVGHKNLSVDLYGARVLLLHLPLVFVMGRVLRQEDVIRIAKWTMFIAIPMTVLMAVQYRSPPSAWVNVGAGGEGTATYIGAMGLNRPPGTWTFITGPMAFYPTAAALWFGLFASRRASLLLLGAAGIAIMLACPVSISRGLVLAVAIVAVVGVLALLKRGIASPGKVVSGFLIFVVMGAATFAIPEFGVAREAFMSRWDSSTTNRGGVDEAIVGRVSSGFTQPFDATEALPTWGYGLGIGTQVGSQLATGSHGFITGEGEWNRVIGEMGLLLGSAVLLIRVAMALYMLRLAFREWFRGNEMPALLLSACFLDLIQGQWGQPTQLGSVMLTAGLMMASIQPKRALSRRPIIPQFQAPAAHTRRLA